MEHNLGDSLNLDSTMGEMGFESSDIVVNQADITLDTHDGDMTMEFEHIEEQQILMDSGNEEIIVSDFIGDQFNLQEYSIQDDQTSEMTTVEDSNLSSQSETMVDLQFESQNVIQSTPDAKGQPQYIAVRAAPSVHPSTSKKLESTVLTTIPRQVAIAPKPPRLVPITSNRFTVPQNKQIAIAPKPVAMITNKTNFIKKVPLSSVQGGATGNSVLAQIGKQLVVMPPGVSQKIKLVATNNPGVSVVQYIKAANDQAQLIPNKNASAQQTNKPMLAKVIQVQGQHNIDLANQPAVITKIAPTSTANVQQTRYIMQTKTVPISIGNKVVMASPTKQGVKFTKKQQIISIKSPTPKLMPAPVTSTGPTTKKVVISANPSQNVILKTTAPSKTAQVLEVTKDGKVAVQGQRSQLHQINVPGKGIQYIRLITNQTPATSKSVTKTQAISVSTTPKTFVLSDNKGPQKLMRIAAAPVSVKSAPVSQATVRSSQSLLAPLSPVDMEQDSDYSIKQEQSSTERVEVAVSTEETLNEVQDESFDGAQDSGSEDADVDSKVTLQDLLTRAPSRDLLRDLKNSQSQTGNKNTKSMEETSEQRSQEHPLIVISTDYGRISQDGVEGDSRQEQSNTMVNEDVDVLNAYHSPKSPPGESDVMSGDLAFKPRRACNCTKSQCLKLYCDCFANGEFCNRCNCNNCHNNLDHEDLRQMAIRACLDRNPNAFRPKIGKTKAGGPEIIRRHNKGCNCKRSGCLKNYCECYEAKIACTSMCRCVGCRNIEDALGRRRPAALYRPQHQNNKQPCTFMTTEVIEAVCQCLLAAAADGHARADPDPVRNVVDEFGRCLQDIIGASHHQLLDQRRA